MRPATCLPLLLLATCFASTASAQSFADARWIWSDAGSRPAGESCLLRRTLALPAAPAAASAAISADNRFRLRVNGAELGRGDDWSHAVTLDLTRALRAGDNVIEAQCTNEAAGAASPAGFLFAAEIQAQDGSRTRLVSDASWSCVPKSADGGEGAPAPVRELGAYGCAPWGEVASPRPAIVVDPLPGFRVEPVVEGIGSIDAFTWVARGRLIASVEGLPLLELIDQDGDGATETNVVFSDALRECQGLLWRGDSLFATGDGPGGHGLYRVRRAATSKPDVPELPELLVKFDGDLGEHGPHAVIDDPSDGEDGALFVMVGNHARLAEPPAASSPYRITYEGHLLPPYLDPRGHAVDCKAPGGFVIRVVPSESGAPTCELFTAGFRNAYDFAFDARGELFTFDSDMEWDVGLPWYRPCRLLHLVAGGEYGWRTGSKVWPDHYADSLPATLDTGRGSPTGMALCTGDRFPARFRGAILAGDWSLGQILAFRLEPRGASYVATSEVLLRGRPLNVTDLVMDDDGSLLFSVGGRGTQGGIHRLAYDGPREEAAHAKPAASAPRAAKFGESTAIASLLAALADEDRFVRFEAGRELERRAPESYETAALAHESPLARGAALVALARGSVDRADAERHAPRIAEAMRILAEGATGTTRLTALRALELLLLDPDVSPMTMDLVTSVGGPLLALFPTGDRAADREIAQLLASLGPSGAVAKIWAAFTREPSREQRIALAYSMRATGGEWPEGVRLELCRWLERTIAAGAGGMSFEGYLRHLREDVALGLTDEERATLAAEAAAAANATGAAAAGVVGTAATDTAAFAAEPRDLDRTLQVIERTLRAPRRSPADGALLYRELCASCHRRADAGAAVGPDLTTIGARFGLRDLLESLISPARNVSDQYRALNVFLKDGDVKSGLPLLDDGKTLVLVESSGRRAEIPADRIASRKASTTSVMPSGLLDRLTLEQVADLCAWLLADAADDSSRAAPAAAPGWQPLFDRRSLAGFEGDPKRWRVDGETIAGTASGLAAPTDLIATQPRSDFTIEFELRLASPDADSGFLFRASRAAPDRLAGYEADAGGPRVGTLNDTGPEAGSGRGVLAQAKNEIWRTLADPIGWNHFVVTARGDRIAIEVNGDLCVDLTDPNGHAIGLLGFRLEPGAKNDLRVRNVRLRE